MPKSLQINVAEPCHENWQNMTPQEQGRFCGACQKTVVDFSMMSDKELLDYFSNVSGYKACGRFSNDQLNRTIKIAENKQRFSWAYLWNIVVATFLITEANAQVNPKKKKTTVEHPNLLRRAGAAKQRAYTPSLVSISKPDTVDPAISTIEYKARTMNAVDGIKVQQPVKDPTFELRGHVGGISVVERIPLRERVNRAVNNILPSSLKKDIVVYPNPVTAGNYARVKLNLPKDNLYKLEVLSVGGQVMHVLYSYMQTKEHQVALPTEESWNAGVYWIRITSSDTKKVYQNKLIVD